MILMIRCLLEAVWRHIQAVTVVQMKQKVAQRILLHLGHCYQFYKSQQLLIYVGKGLFDTIHQKEKRNAKLHYRPVVPIPNQLLPPKDTWSFKMNLSEF